MTWTSSSLGSRVKVGVQKSVDVVNSFEMTGGSAHARNRVQVRVKRNLNIATKVLQ